MSASLQQEPGPTVSPGSLPRSHSVRFVTYNIWGAHGAWEKRRPVLANRLRALQPDIVALQEAVVRDGYDQVVDVLGRDYYVAHQSLHGDDGSGNSIASRWPLGDVRELDLVVTPRVGHGWLAC